MGTGRGEERRGQARRRRTDATESWGSSPDICHEEVPLIRIQEIYMAGATRKRRCPDPVRILILAMSIVLFSVFIFVLQRLNSLFMICRLIKKSTPFVKEKIEKDL
jgi:hypothetical protein